jgi:hypothetical protein
LVIEENSSADVADDTDGRGSRRPERTHPQMKKIKKMNTGKIRGPKPL